MTEIDSKRTRTPLRLGVMAVMLVAVVGMTLWAQAQPGETPTQPTQPPVEATPPPPANANQAQPADTAGPGAPVQEPEANEMVDVSDQPIYQIRDLFMFSPIINGIIAGLSVLGLLFFLFFMMSINRRSFAPPRFVDEVVKLVIRGDYERAADVCRRSRGVFAASIVQRCIENNKQAHSVMLDMIDTEGRRQADIIWNRVSYLADISNIAPMLGLVGTVLGMIKAFYGLEHESGGIDAVVLSKGIGEAMSTTLFGLSVGILTLVFYSIAKSRATRTLADAEQAVHMIADHIKRDEGVPSDPKAALHAGRPPLR